MDWLDQPELLLKLHDQLDELINELDDEDAVPDRYQSNLAAVLADSDSVCLNQASRIIHRLYLNARFPKLVDLQANYVKFDQEVESGEGTS